MNMVGLSWAHEDSGRYLPMIFLLQYSWGSLFQVPLGYRSRPRILGLQVVRLRLCKEMDKKMEITILRTAC